MEKDIIVLRDMVAGFKDEASFIKAYVELRNAIAFLKEQMDKLTRMGIEWAGTEGIKEIQLGDGIKIYFAKEKKDRFDSPAIYKALKFTEPQINALPKNPAWRKSVILSNPETAVAYYEEEKDTMRLGEVDTELMKRMGR